LVELSVSEQDQLCGYIEELEDGVIRLCDMGQVVGVFVDRRPCGDFGFPGQLALPGHLSDNCAATVDDTERCYELAISCSRDIDVACAAVRECVGLGVQTTPR
jgi:hypothetical protein